MGNSGRFGRSRDRAAHPGRGELVFAGVAAGPAGQAFKPRRQRFRVGKSATLSPPIVISRIDIALRPAVVSQDFSTGWYSLTDAPGPARKAQSAEAERVKLTKAASRRLGEVRTAKRDFEMRRDACYAS